MNDKECPNCAAMLITEHDGSRIYCEYCGYEKKLFPQQNRVPYPQNDPHPDVIYAQKGNFNVSQTPILPEVEYKVRMKKYRGKIAWVIAFDAVITFLASCLIAVGQSETSGFLITIPVAGNLIMPWIIAASKPVRDPRQKLGQVIISAILLTVLLEFIFGAVMFGTLIAAAIMEST